MIMNKKRMIMKKLKKNKATIIKNAVTIALPVSAVAVCLIMGMKTDNVEKTSDLNTIAYTTTASTTSLHITYTMLTTATTTAYTTATTIPSVGIDDNLALNAVSLGYTDVSTDITCASYRAWNMYGNSMPIIDDYGNIYDYKFVDSDLLTYIYNECERYNVPFEMALATCFVESNFTADVNNEGLNEDGSIDYGYMGLNGNYLMENCIAYNGGLPINRYNPYENVHIGIQILSENLKYFGDSVWDAANAYNLGIGGWEEMNAYCGYWYYGEKILNYMNVLYNMPTDNSTDYLNEDWSVD